MKQCLISIPFYKFMLCTWRMIEGINKITDKRYIYNMPIINIDTTLILITIYVSIYVLYKHLCLQKCNCYTNNLALCRCQRSINYSSRQFNSILEQGIIMVFDWCNSVYDLYCNYVDPWRWWKCHIFNGVVKRCLQTIKYLYGKSKMSLTYNIL